MELCTVPAILKFPKNNALSPAIHSISHLLPKHSLSVRQAPVIGTAGNLLSRSTSLRYLLPRATTSEETSGGTSQYVDEKRDGAIILEEVKTTDNNEFNGIVATEETKEESPVDEIVQPLDFVDKLNIKMIDGIHRMFDETSAVMSNLSGYLSSFLVFFFFLFLLEIVYNLEEFEPFDTHDTGSLLLYGGGAIIALWLTLAVVGAIDSIPLFPKLMEVVGLAYTLWFTSRYLLFKKSRDELAAKIEELKEQVLGLEDE